MPDKKPKDSEEELAFEEALGQLEKLVAEMESGNLPLEESLKKFEQGMALSKLCADKLTATEKKIEVLVKRADAALEWEPTELGTDSDGATRVNED